MKTPLPALRLVLVLSLLALAADAATPPSGLQVFRQSGVSFAQGPLTILERESVLFTVSASGDFPRTHQWRKDGQPITGATNGSFVIATTKATDAGAYSVVVANAAGSATSTDTALSVTALPVIRQSPAAVLVGGAVTLTAVVPAGVGPTGSQWFFKGQAIPGATSLTYTRPSLRLADDGSYSFQCTYTNLGRVVRAPRFHAKVYPAFTAPLVVTQPKAQTGRAGGSAVFTVGTSGTPPFSYQWLRNAAPISGATNFFLALTNLQPADATTYSVTVTGFAGATNSATAALTLGSAPAPNATADALVGSGRAALTLHSNPNLISAAATFGAAVGLDPAHETGNFFQAVTRLANLVNQPATTNFLNRLLVSPTGRDPYHWQATATRDADGLVAPAGVNTDELPLHLRTNALPEILGALTNFARIGNPDFIANVTEAEAGFGNVAGGATSVNVDQGDLWMGRALLHLGQYTIHHSSSWNLSSLLTTFRSLYTNDAISLQRILQDHPQLLTFSDLSQLAPARAAIEAGIDAYVQGAGSLRSRPPGTRRLLNLDAEDYDGEEQFRQSLLDLKGSLNAVLTANEQPQISVNFARMFDGSRSIRSLTPTFSGNEPDAETLSDVTMGGLVSVVGQPYIVVPLHATRVAQGATARLSVAAVGSGPLNYLWQKNGVTIPGATNATLVLPNVRTADIGSYRVRVSNAEGNATSVAKLSMGGGVVLAWGSNDQGQTNVPVSLSDVVAIAVGESHNLALKSDGTVVGWGANYAGQISIPFGLSGVIAVAAGRSHSLALKSNGALVAWGDNSYGQTVIPAGLSGVMAIGAGGSHNVVLKIDGTVAAWGDNSFGETTIPVGLSGVSAIAAGYSHTVALKSDGTVVAWGNNTYGQTSLPSGLSGVSAIAAGYSHTVALKSDGTVLAWGYNGNGQTTIPVGLSGVVAIAANAGAGPFTAHTVALRNNGTVVAWGANFSGQTSVPAGLSGVTAIAAGGSHTVVMGPILLTGLNDAVANTGGSVTFAVTPRGSGPFTYQWRFDGFPIPGATSATLTLANLQPSAAGSYSVVVSDGTATVVSASAKLVVNSVQDAFAQPRVIPGGGGRLLGSTLGATREPGEPFHAGNVGGHSLWFAWTAPASATVTVDTIGSNFDTLLAVYTGTVLTNLTLLAANDDGAGINFNSRLTFAATAGVTYLIAVDGYNASSGGVVLNLTPGLSIVGLTRTSFGELRFQTSGPGTSNVVIQGSLDLRIWTPLSTNPVPEGGFFQFADPTSTNALRRFYRAVVE
ncbi:MAG: hypothetical protein B9S33_08300 [Pedosphaera sp. Tous-C6FEB]|nr:MAG: hypothetical protein B9S33_08300 [Pedosphaera sp. Tous-C6FEB]